MILAAAPCALATITLPNFYGDSMVLRADVPVLINGVEDDPGGRWPVAAWLPPFNLRS